MRVGGNVRVIRLALPVILSLFPFNAQALEAAFDGAWLESGSTTCEEVFTRKGKSVSFKRPINIFLAAFIIRGDRLQTAQTTCRIRGIRPIENRRRFSLQCTTPIAVENVTALLSITPDGSLRRYFNEEDHAGSAYTRCGS
jgi:hypothetical protein